MLTNDRTAMRRAFTKAWQRHRDGLPLSAQQQLIADVITLHPEYQAGIEQPTSLERDYDGGDGQSNPYLHMGMHIAIREQVAIDRPPGVRSLHQRLSARSGDVHAAEHVLLECLGQVLWQAQASGQEPDVQAYLECARRQA